MAAEVRRLGEVHADVARQLAAAQGEEAAQRAKLGHLRAEADVAQAACDRARASEAEALRVRACLNSRTVPGLLTPALCWRPCLAGVCCWCLVAGVGRSSNNMDRRYVAVLIQAK